jgi:hypothetical protein
MLTTTTTTTTTAVAIGQMEALGAIAAVILIALVIVKGLLSASENGKALFLRKIIGVASYPLLFAFFTVILAEML